MKNAIKTSEESWIEQQMLEDKKRATDWEATNEAIEEQVARESYLQWLRDQEKQARQVSREADPLAILKSTYARTSRGQAVMQRASAGPSGHIRISLNTLEMFRFLLEIFWIMICKVGLSLAGLHT